MENLDKVDNVDNMDNLNENEMRQLLDDLKKQWTDLWRNRIDDRVKAEGIASVEYQRLFVDRGEVIIATRDFKPLNLKEILERYRLSHLPGAVPSHPEVGGLGKFIRSTLKKQQSFGRVRRPAPKPERKERQQQKKSGGGWLHFKMRE